MVQVGQRGLYYIKQVADMTGLSRQVIRKWEERYGLIEPKRLENGYRVYSQTDINKLLKAKKLTEQGQPIKQASEIVKALFEQNGQLVNEIPDKKMYEPLNEFVLDLLEKGARCSEIGLQFTLQQAYGKLGLEQFISSIAIPFLKEVGDKWERGEWDEYQEAVSSLIFRDYLVQIRRNYWQNPESPFALGACLPNEQHEIPLHLLLLQAMIKGWKTQLIGASPAPQSIQSLVDRIMPDIVLLSATTTAPFDHDPSLFSTMENFAASKPSIEFYIGGEGASRYLENKKTTSIHLVRSLDEVFELTAHKPTFISN
ncbi:MerR family transcriptional regulator [Siminovitchia acidinfaciens]|uniref:MerR family transcriptional regulator n=1 Tax=Siminovitchia acidinfaciens TaxID=2321395 RepID=A0A429Y2E8_9BACI|nr:MerR family transcriptional regulator [Siminovitchia acidinfaciens]RST75423.1 MerR family transcriptional regulator [Siminovitchia acidinfaciens]